MSKRYVIRLIRQYTRYDDGLVIETAVDQAFYAYVPDADEPLPDQDTVIRRIVDRLTDGGRPHGVQRIKRMAFVFDIETEESQRIVSTTRAAYTAPRRTSDDFYPCGALSDNPTAIAAALAYVESWGIP